MNYKEVRQAKILLDNIENLDRMLDEIEKFNYVEIRSANCMEYFEDESKRDIIDSLTFIRSMRVRELNELGVTEETN